MRDRIRKHLPLLEYLVALPKLSQSQNLKILAGNVVKLIIDILLNVQRGNLTISEAALGQLKVYKKEIASLTQAKKSLLNRKVELLKKNLFSKIIGPLLPILREV